MQTEQPRRRDLFLGFLAVVSVCSVLLNGALLFHVSHPSFWREFRLSWLQPPELRAGDHVRGEPNARTTVVEYADFQCPYCQHMHVALQTAVEEGRIRWVYRHLPLASIHPLAFREAEAAECAGAQGKFWEYADALFAAQRRISTSQLLEDELAVVAHAIDVDTTLFNQCLEAGQFHHTIESHAHEAEALQISGTPTIFIDNERHEGSLSYSDLKLFLDKHRS